MYFIQQIVSGGQTGVDCVAMDVAKELKIHFGDVQPKKIVFKKN